jgi:iron complex transport system permease protein
MRPLPIIALLCSVLVLSVACTLLIGAVPIAFSDVFTSLFFPHLVDATTVDIIVSVRLPRLCIAIIVGMALSCAGATFQGVLRNDLADPYTLGVASGAAFGAASAFAFTASMDFGGLWIVPIGAFVSALATLGVVFAISHHQHTASVILAGIIVQAFLAAAVSSIIFAQGSAANTIVFWMMGKLSMRGWDFVAITALPVIASTILLCVHGQTINVFSLGEQKASSLGVSVFKKRWALLGIATLASSFAVATAGVIGFVGLLVPHIVRLLVGDDYRIVLPSSAIAGSIYVLWADALARTLIAPTELPIGIVTALLGAPFFLYVLRKRMR